MPAEVVYQPNFFGWVDPEPVERDHLATPLSREEQRRIGKMYAEHIRLIGMFQARLRKKYGHCIPGEDINSAVDVAFIRAARTWDETKGRLSTIFWHFAVGEVRHAIRAASNWGIAATQRARETGLKARAALDRGHSVEAVCRVLEITEAELQDCLLAVTGLAHDVHGFDLHICSRPTPWDVLEAAETFEAT